MAGENYVIKTVIITGGDEIPKNAFSEMNTLEKVILPNTIKVIGEKAFAGCDKLTEITIPNSVAIIGENAFDNCTGLTEIIIPDSVKSMGKGMLYGCYNLKKLTIPYASTDNRGIDSDYTQVSDLFVWSSSRYSDMSDYADYLISTIEITGGDKIIANSFSGMGMLKEIILPNTIKEIGESAFDRCIGLTSVTIPNSVTTIEDGAFCGCSRLTSVTILNKDCNISTLLWGWDAPIPQNAVIYGYINSTAQAYAEEYDIKFVSLDEPATTTSTTTTTITTEPITSTTTASESTESTSTTTTTTTSETTTSTNTTIISTTTTSETTTSTSTTTTSITANHIASDEELCNWAVNDYQSKTGITPEKAEINKISDGKYEIIL